MHRIRYSSRHPFPTKRFSRTLPSSLSLVLLSTRESRLPRSFPSSSLVNTLCPRMSFPPASSLVSSRPTARLPRTRGMRKRKLPHPRLPFPRLPERRGLIRSAWDSAQSSLSPSARLPRLPATLSLSFPFPRQKRFLPFPSLQRGRRNPTLSVLHLSLPPRI